MNKLTLSVCSLLLSILINPAYGRIIDGFDFDEVIPATAERPELKLNGAAVRNYYYMIDTYVGLMYLERPSQFANEVIIDDSHKRMVYHILMKKVSGRRIAKALYEAMQLNVSKEEAIALEDRLNRLVKMFDTKMVRGDSGIVDYIPGLGTRITIKNEVKGIIPGKDFYDALLKIWIGENPVSHAFKKQILEGSEQSISQTD
jgi:hypothetical protein